MTKTERQKYPANWEAISLAVLIRDQWRCGRCNLKQFSVIERHAYGRFTLHYEGKSWRDAKRYVEETYTRTGKKLTLITLKVAHLFNDDPLACDSRNLGSRCSYCHFLLDDRRHATKTQATVRKKNAAAKKDNLSSFVDDLF